MATTISNRKGLERGIQFWKNSCYVDTTLMLFYYTHQMTDAYIDRSSIYYPKLKKILEKLRKFPYYCQSQYVLEFREVLELHQVFDRRITGAFMDVEEFLRGFLKAIYQNQFWLSYDNGGKNCYHQIFLGTGMTLPRSIGLQQLFNASMHHQGLHFSRFPEPLLLIKTPFSGGTLMGFDYIVPSLTLAVDFQGDKKSYELIGVSSYANNHYTAYIRDLKKHTWMYYNSLGKDGKSEVVPCPHVERWLDHFTTNPHKELDIIPKNQVLARLCSTMIMAFYAPPERTTQEYLIEEVEVVAVEHNFNTVAREQPMGWHRPDYIGNGKCMDEWDEGICGFGPSNLLVILTHLFIRHDSPILPQLNLSNNLTPLKEKVEILKALLENRRYVTADCTTALTTFLNSAGLKSTHHNDPSSLLRFLLHYCNIPALIQYRNGSTNFLAELAIHRKLKLHETPKHLYDPFNIWFKSLDTVMTSVAPILIFSVDKKLLEKINVKPVFQINLKLEFRKDMYELFAIVCYFGDNNFGSYRPLGPGDGEVMKWHKNFHLYSPKNERLTKIQLIKTPDMRHWTSSTADEDVQIIMGKSRLIFYKQISSKNSANCTFL